jgi:redox-sensitive bicupin YhaK (pirin superfamily)
MSVMPHAEPSCAKVAEGTTELEIQARSRALTGEVTVRRVLPALARRMVGPFIFFDHMGPVRLAPGRGLDVPPHPHIGLATVTYLFDGEILHRDSIGSEQLITPGAVNWMTAGRGVVHSERTPVSARDAGARLHGLQSWVALPTVVEEVEPSFRHHPASTLPVVVLEDTRVRVLAGSAFGVTSPVQVLSPLFYADAELEPGGALDVPDGHAARAAYVVEGSISSDGKEYGAGTMIVFREGVAARVSGVGRARTVLLGGAPLDGERHIWWNFVSSSLERIEQAKRAWKERRFPTIPGDEHERVPLPPEIGKPR